jgi:hypothetical protein
VEAWARCEPPTASIKMIPAVAPTAATVATAAAARGCRRGCRRHDGPGEPGGFGNPVRPNAPARCAVLTRPARPAGVLSVQAFSICQRSPAGSSTAAKASSPLADRGIFGSGDVTPAALRRRRHSLRATACSQRPSLPGSRSPASLEVAMRKVSRTTSAASGPGNAKLQYA